MSARCPAVQPVLDATPRCRARFEFMTVFIKNREGESGTRHSFFASLSKSNKVRRARVCAMIVAVTRLIHPELPGALNPPVAVVTVPYSSMLLHILEI